jgi:hypothetical protein
MNLIWGVILLVFTLLIAWLGQVISTFWPALATKWGLLESELEVDSTFYVDARAEAVWDTLVLWTLPVAGILLIFDNPAWAYFGLAGGGMYLYFAGRGIIVRQAMRRRGIRTGRRETLKLYYVFLTIWALIAVVTIVLAVAALSSPPQPVDYLVDLSLNFGQSKIVVWQTR